MMSKTASYEEVEVLVQTKIPALKNYLDKFDITVKELYLDPSLYTHLKFEDDESEGSGVTKTMLHTIEEVYGFVLDQVCGDGTIVLVHKLAKEYLMRLH